MASKVQKELDETREVLRDVLEERGFQQLFLFRSSEIYEGSLAAVWHGAVRARSLIEAEQIVGAHLRANLTDAMFDEIHDFDGPTPSGFNIEFTPVFDRPLGVLLTEESEWRFYGMEFDGRRWNWL